MRLINVETMKLEEYWGSQIPRYAILSHCWGTEEVTFQDIIGPDWRQMRGASKIERSSSICHENDLKYIWIDTCCIDKSSSAELSEAINSMYNWYAKSVVCYTYLEDIDYSEGIESIRSSRWFTRGWTLQELIAPSQIEFFDQQWMLVGKKTDLSALLSDITSIPENVLEDPSELASCSVARKMSWAAHRKTTREEDIAYCLLGIFDVNMPLLYGEGAKAFTRLQEEILKEVDDQSLFAWGLPSPDRLQNKYPYLNHCTGVLAIHPVDFSMSKNIVSFPSKTGKRPYSMTNKGLHIELPISREPDDIYIYWIALLDCHYEDDFLGVIGLLLVETEKSFEFMRSTIRFPGSYSIERLKEAELRTIFIRKRPLETGRKKSVRKCLIRVKSTQPNDYTIEQLEGYNAKWNPKTMVLNMTFDLRDRYPPSTIMFLDEHGNSSFAIIIGFRRRRSGKVVNIPKLINVVNILPKPRDFTLDEWKEECKGAKIDWDGTQEKEVQLNKLQHDSGMDSLAIKATITMEEVLNQWIYVLTIEMRRDVTSGVVNSTKWDKFNVLSYLK